MSTEWSSCALQKVGKGGCAADPVSPLTSLWSSNKHGRGPVLRTEEGQEGAVLCNDDESLGSASRQNSLADCGLLKQSSFEAVQCNMDDYEVCSNGGVETPVQTAQKPSSSMSEAPQSEADLMTEQAVSEAEAGTSGHDDSYGTDDDQFSDVGEAPDTEVVYVREGVAVWPTKNQRIMGRLSLIKQHQVMFLAWLPYSQGSLNKDGTFYSSATAEKSATQSAKDRTMYAVHPIPLSEVKAVRKHAPSFGWQYIVLVLVNGLTLPPLYFGTGGVRALFAALKQHVYLVKGSEDPNSYLVNDTADPLQRSLTCLELTDVLMGAPPPGASSTWGPPAGGAWVGPDIGSTVAWQDTGDNRAPLVASVLEQFGRMTALAKETTSNLLTSTAYWGAQPDEEALDAAAACPPAVQPPQPQPEGPPPLVVARQAAQGLAGDHEQQHDRQHSGEHTSTSVGVFELIDKSGAKLPVDRRPSSPAPPVYQEEFDSFFNCEGRMVGWKKFKERVFSSGIEPSLRQTAWTFLLGFYSYDSTLAERRAQLASKRAEYARMKCQWRTLNDEQASRNAKWQERRSRVDKDVHRTDRQQPFFSESRSHNTKQLRNILLTYIQYNHDLGYCQGMSDLASPILYIMRDEAEAFWCFTALMRRLEGNFQQDSMAMHGQLLALRKLVQLLDPPMHVFMEAKSCLNYFFCYRWLLIHFKREFAFDEVLRFWEALWSNPHHEHFHLFVCVAVLEHHRRAIMNSCQDFDDLLKFCVELSGRIPMTSVLQDADALCKWAGDAGLDCVAELTPVQTK
ncbi:TPA: hypothetical protein ACH3X3_007597 [Trebouxia sp. C0006]